MNCHYFGEEVGEEITNNFDGDFISMAYNATFMGRILPRSCRNKEYRFLVRSKHHIRNNENMIILNSVSDNIWIDKFGKDMVRKLYAIRNYLGCYCDFGRRKEFLYMSAQADDPELIQRGFYEQLFGTVKSVIGKAVKATYEVVSGAFNAVMEKVFGMFSFFGGEVNSIFTTILERIKETLVAFLSLPGKAVSAMGGLLRNCVIGFTVVIMGAIGLIGTKLIGFIFEFLVPMMRGAYVKTEVNLNMPRGMTAQAPLDPTSSLIGSVMMLMAWKGSVSDRITKTCRDLIAMVAAGSIMKSVWLMILSLMPIVLREALIYQFGSKEMVQEIEVTKWREKATGLYSLSKNPTVTSGEEYKKRLVEVVSEGHELISKVTNPGIRSMFTTMHNKMIHLYSILVQSEVNGVSRPLPFSLHLYGDPGIGKTILSKRIIQECYGARINDIYTIPNGEFFDGFMGQKHMLWDEFLVASPDIIEKQLSTYMQLVSNGQFQPPLASVDSLQVGIKGTVARPLTLTTINNSKKWSSGERGVIKDEAINRRRNIVLKLVRNSARWYSTPGNDSNVDLSRYTLQELRDCVWISACFVDPLDKNKGEANTINGPEGTVVKMGDMVDVTTALSVIKMMYQSHSVLISSMAEASGSVVAEQSSIELIENYTRQGYGLPTQPLTLGQAFKQVAKEYLPSVETLQGILPFMSGQGGKRASRVSKIMPIIFNAPGVEVVETPVVVVGDELTDDSNTDYDSINGDSGGSGSTPEQPMKMCEFYQQMWDNPKYIPRAGSWNVRPYIIMEKDEIDEMLDTYCSCGNRSHEIVVRRSEQIEESTSWLSRTLWFALKMTSIVLICNMIYSMIYGTKTEESMTFVVLPEMNANSPKKGETEGYRDKKTAWRKSRFDKKSVFAQGGKRVNFIVMEYGGMEVKMLPIYGRTFLTYAHWFIPDMEKFRREREIKTVYLRIGGKRYTAQLEHDMIDVDCNNDLMIVTFNETSFQQFPDITKQFISREDVFSMNQVAITLRTTEGDKLGRGRFFATPESYDYHGQTITINGAMKYELETEVGDCGSPLIGRDGRINGRIIGLHVAGGVSERGIKIGMSTIVVSEDLVEYKKERESGSENNPRIDDDLYSSTNFVACSTDYLIEVLGTDTTEENLKCAKAELKRRTRESAAFHAQSKTIEEDIEEIKMGPNIMSLLQISKAEKYFVPETSRIRPSIFNGRVKELPNKAPAILSIKDFRSKNRSPVMESIRRLSNVQNIQLDQGRVDRIFERMLINYSCVPVERKNLTYEEAVRGVPGRLMSIDTSTSPGYPWIYTRQRPGKKDHVIIDQDELWTSEEMRRTVSEILEEMNNVNRRPCKHKFVGFLKDELVSQTKIDGCVTRAIFCNSVSSMIAFRMKLGNLIIALNEAWYNTPLTIGINQNSHDMHSVYLYLSRIGGRFLAGDYKNFDQNHNRQVREAAYNLIRRLAGDLITDLEWDYIFRHEVFSPCIFGQFEFVARSNHFSGCFFTTLINCFVGEGYMRYVFDRLQPGLDFDENVRLKVLGDDNIVCVSDRVEITPRDIEREMLSIGQVYTHADKKSTLGRDWFKFEEITFLGTHPVLVENMWSGAQRKESLWETIQWVHTGKTDSLTVARDCLRMATQWDRDFFTEYLVSINKVLVEEDEEPIAMSYEYERMVVANQNTRPVVLMKAQAPPVRGLTTIEVETGMSQASVLNDRMSNLASKSVNEQPMNLDYGTDSVIMRDTLRWDVSDGRLKNIYSKQVPFEMLLLGEPENIQNMPFERFIYMAFEAFEVYVQINGSPFLQGLLAMLFVPLRKDPVDVANILSYTHVLMQPNESSTHMLSIPMRFYRSALNTFAGGQSQDSLGMFRIVVISPLSTKSEYKSVEMSISTRLVGAKFSIPRPISGTDKFRQSMFMSLSKSVLTPGSVQNMQHMRMKSQGASVSTTNVSNSYTISDIVGNVPIETITDSNASATAEGSLSVPLPFDKPPCVSGSIPMHMVFPGMSRIAGLDPVVGMQSHPAMMNRQHLMCTNNDETKLEFMVSRPFIHAIIPLSRANASGTELIQVPLNSIFMDLDYTHLSNKVTVSPAVATINLFDRFRYDVRIKIVAVRTPFHSCRLIGTMAYGSPKLDISHRTIFYNSPINFAGENSVWEMDFPYNASTEYLRTYSGNKQINPIQDYTFGTFMLSVQNVLKNPDTVPDSIDLVIVISVHNFKAYEMNPSNIVCSQGSGRSWLTFRSIKFDEQPDDIKRAIKRRTTTEQLAKMSEESRKEINNLKTGEITASAIYEAIVGIERTIRTTRHEVHKDQQALVNVIKTGAQLMPSTTTNKTVSMSAQGSDPIVVADETRVVDEPEPIPMTSSESKIGFNSAGKLLIGEKFEFNYVNINEVGRRYMPILIEKFFIPVSFGILGYRSYQIPVIMGDQWACDFAGWAGHVNYRIFVQSPDIVMTRLISIDNKGSAEENLIVGSVFNNSVGRYKYRQESSSFRDVALTEAPYGLVGLGVPTEIHMPIGNTQHMISVSIPFNTHLNFLPVSDELNSNVSTSCCILELLISERSYDRNEIVFQVFKSVGDDFSLLVYSPTTHYLNYTNQSTTEISSGARPDHTLINGFRSNVQFQP